MTWLRRSDALILWLAGVAYLVLGLGLVLLGAIDGHWLLYCGVAALALGLALLYAATAAARHERPVLVLWGNIFSLILLPPLGLIGLVLYLVLRRRQPRPV